MLPREKKVSGDNALFHFYFEFLKDTFVCFDLEREGSAWREPSWEGILGVWRNVSRPVCFRNVLEMRRTQPVAQTDCGSHSALSAWVTQRHWGQTFSGDSGLCPTLPCSRGSSFPNIT